MKKLVYTFALGMVLSFGFTSCSFQDEVLDDMEDSSVRGRGD